MEYTDIELKNEKWKDIEGYDGVYQVSDLGRVRSKKYGDWRLLRPKKSNSGYFSVNLCKYGKQKTVKIHRLVAQAFIPNDDNSKTIINHRNECKSDNRVSNIEWCDYKYNNHYNDLYWRKKSSVRRKIEKLYRPELSSKENIEIFRANGISCSRHTLWQLRKDLGLIGSNSQPVRSKIKELYRPDLSIDDNIKLFRANGIECGRTTLWQLRKELGLIESQPVRSKIKKLYDKNLTYAQNLEIFKANGIDCHYNTVKNLRKELGLIN